MSFKIPSPHDLGIHKVLKHIRPIINPLVDTFSKHRLNNAVNIADLRICARKRSHKMVFDYSGVIKAFEILSVELDRAMGLLGVGCVEELKHKGTDLIKRRI